MKLSEIQTNLQTVIQAIPSLAAVQSLVFADNGLDNTPMEEGLKTDGLAILIMAPQGEAVSDKARGAVVIDYSAAVWIRTNPKVVTGDAPAWNPLVCESEILSAVMQWSKDRNDWGFHLVPGIAPGTDWTDTGNHSRLIHFITRVQFT